MQDPAGENTLTRDSAPADSTARDEQANRLLDRFFPARALRKVLLVNPPDVDASYFRYEAARRRRYANFPPYGLAVLATHLRSAGVEVRIVDLNHEVLKRCLQSADEPSFDFEAAWQSCLTAAVEEFRPDWIGATCMFTMTHASFRAVCSYALRFGVPIAIGGVHVTNEPQRILQELPEVGMAFLGEADMAIRDFVAVVNGQRPVGSLRQLVLNDRGTLHRFEGEHRPTSDEMDVIPAFDLLDLANYSRFGSIGAFRHLLAPDTRSATSLSNRGCRARCTFCTVHAFNGPGVRQRSVVSVVDELELLRDRHGIRHIVWLDDDLLRDHRRAIGLFHEMTRRRLEMTWDATNGVIATSCKEDVIAAAVESGCIGVHIGMESGNREILKRVKKPSTVEGLLAAAEVLRKHEQIFASVFVLIGFPGETLRMIRDTIDVAREMNLDWYSIGHVEPLPNTPMFDELMAQDESAPDRHAGRETRYVLGHYGEAAENDAGCCASDDVLRRIPPDAIPTKAELADIWFYMDYHLNFKRLFTEDRPRKLDQQVKQLTKIKTVLCPNHGFALYFLCHLQRRLWGRVDQGLFAECEQALEQSPYWKDRLGDFGLALGDLQEPSAKAAP